MLHAFFDERPWFAARRFGYGAGLPIAWQGWALSAAYLGALVGTALMLDRTQPLAGSLAVGAGMGIATLAYLAIVAKRTQGGFRWRWGRRD